jgi:hypothetical protein
VLVLRDLHALSLLICLNHLPYSAEANCKRRATQAGHRMPDQGLDGARMPASPEPREPRPPERFTFWRLSTVVTYRPRVCQNGGSASVLAFAYYAPHLYWLAWLMPGPHQYGFPYFRSDFERLVRR